VLLRFPVLVAGDLSGVSFDAPDTPAMNTSPIAVKLSLRADI